MALQILAQILPFLLETAAILNKSFESQNWYQAIFGGEKFINDISTLSE